MATRRKPHKIAAEAAIAVNIRTGMKPKAAPEAPKAASTSKIKMSGMPGTVENI